MLFDKFGLQTELVKAVKSKGYTAPTPVQTGLIPAILNGHDVLARARTGTGKTDAFALPIVELLSRDSGNQRYPRALVMAPTRELALQVGESIKAYGRRVSIRCTVVYGGVNIVPQINRLKRGIDILVATPGRLLDLASHRGLKLSMIEFLVFDEADRMLDMGFHEEISEVLELVPTNRRTMLFSATYTRQIRALAKIMLKEPEYIEVTPGNTIAESIVQKVHLVDRHTKTALLIHLITREQWTQALVFVRTKYGADKLTRKLAAKGISAAALHGNKSQSFRTRTFKDFKNGEIRILVATDVAARGLDISNLPHVVNYDMPGVPEDYIHRIGRTGRAGVSGIAISLVSFDEKAHLKAIKKLLNQKIPTEKVEGYTVDSTVPQFVLLRPGNPSSERKADKDLKEVVNRRKISKQGSLSRTGKSAGSGKAAWPGKAKNSGKTKAYNKTQGPGKTKASGRITGFRKKTGSESNSRFSRKTKNGDKISF